MNKKNNNLKKVECHITEEKRLLIESLCEETRQTRAEFVRRALDSHIETTITKQAEQYKLHKSIT